MDVTGDQCGALLDLASKGDRTAYGTFVDLTATRACALVRAMGVLEPEPVLVDAYLDAWHHLDDFVTQDLSATAWLLVRVQEDVGRRSGGQTSRDA
jgi:DNA-directed RNA polymerase specialized sigma24 family protein